MSPDRIRSVLPSCWSIETSHGWRADNPARAQCNATAMVVQDLCGGDILKTDAPTGWHFYNRVAGRIHDMTASQFASPLAYDHTPSSRAEAGAGARRGQYDLLRARVVLRLAALVPAGPSR